MHCSRRARRRGATPLLRAVRAETPLRKRARAVAPELRASLSWATRVARTLAARVRVPQARAGMAARRRFSDYRRWQRQSGDREPDQKYPLGHHAGAHVDCWGGGDGRPRAGKPRRSLLGRCVSRQGEQLQLRVQHCREQLRGGSARHGGRLTIAAGAYAAFFVNYGASDVHLKPGSSAIDAGTTTDAPAIDAERAMRSAPYDVGAYEFGVP